MSKTTKKGFSIVEFSLSCVFLGMMLLGIATLMSNIMKIYNKGLTVRDVNETGESIVEKIRNIIARSGGQGNVNPSMQSAGSELYISEGEVKKKLYTYFIPIEVSDQQVTGAKVQAGGIFCVDDYTFIWNTAQSIQRENSYTKQFKSGSAVGGNDFLNIWNSDSGKTLFVNIYDHGTSVINYATMSHFNSSSMKTFHDHYLYTPRLAYTQNIAPRWRSKSGYENMRNYCEVAEKYTTDNATDLGIVVNASNPMTPEKRALGMRRMFMDVQIKRDDWTDLLVYSSTQQDIDLAFHNFSVMPATTNLTTNQSFYQLSFTLGTVEGGINLNRTGNYCTGKRATFTTLGGDTSSSNTVNRQYCAINKFDFTAVQKGEASL